ncbi:MAG: hypothetical protein ABW092_17240 [Candidatus Thiodiazotropha sp.]
MKYLSNRSITLLLSILLLQGCGGGGGGDDDSDGSSSSGSSSNSSTYTGSTAQATIDASNAKDLATGASSGTQQAVASNALSDTAMRPQATPTTRLAELAPRIAQWINQHRSPVAAKEVDLSNEICDQGGSAVVNSNDAETEGTMIFSNCAINDKEGGTMVLDGDVSFIVDVSSDSMNMVYDVSFSYIEETQSVYMALACSNISTLAISCAVSSDFQGVDGRVYRIKDLTVSGSKASGFYVDMTFYDPDHGSADVATTQPLTYGCEKGVPGSGMISMEGAGGTTAVVSFDSCSSYTVTVDGVGTTHNW